MGRDMTHRRTDDPAYLLSIHGRAYGVARASGLTRRPTGPMQRRGQGRSGRRLRALAALVVLGVCAAAESGPHAAQAGAATAPPSASAIIATAERYLGYPYAAIGDEPATGFSCIGFVHFVFAQDGVFVPEDLGAAYANAPHVDQGDLQPGDLVFFQNTLWAGISHVDLYVGAGKMIGADSFQTGVQWDTLGDAYWQQHYLGATRPLAAIAGTVAIPSATPVATDMMAAPTATPTAAEPTPMPASAAPAFTPTPSEPSPAAAPPSSPTSFGATDAAFAAGMIVTARYETAVYGDPGDADTAIGTVAPATPLTVLWTHGQWVAVSDAQGDLSGWVRGVALDPRGSAGSGSGSAAGSGTRGPLRRATRTPSNPPPGVLPDGHTPGAAGRTVVVTADALLVRDGPSRHAPILGQVTDGDHLPVLTVQGGWDEILLPAGSRGWVSAQWVRDANAD